MPNSKINLTGQAASLPLLQRRVRVALGQEPGDLVLTGGRVVNVFTGQVEPASVVIADGWIAGVGEHPWQAAQTVDLAGQCLLPGLIDGHIHIESTLLTPAELTRLMAPRGTTALIADPHEVGNVLGVPGIDLLLQASDGLPLDFFFMASSCVPDLRWEDAGAAIDAIAVGALLARPRVLGLAEMMNYAGVLAGEADPLTKVLTTLRAGRPVDGHAPGLTGVPLIGYVAAGIRSDHESTTVEEALEKAALGMMVQVREGSNERNLDTLLPLLVADRLGDWCLCSDDIHPDDLLVRGHLDGLLRRLVAAGVPPVRAVRHATLVPARHYGLHDRGAVAPGRRADLVAVEDLRDFRVRRVWKDGRLAAEDGTCLPFATPQVPVVNTMHVAPLDEAAFRLPLRDEVCPVIQVVPGQITTRRIAVPVARRDGCWAFDPARDLALIASVERHRGRGRIGLGLVQGFGLRRRGALASSVAHDAHNLVLVGTDPRDLLACAAAVIEQGGGWAVAIEGEVRACLALPLAGLMATAPLEAVCADLTRLHDAARELGCPLTYPLGTLSFLALPVIPELRITDQGLFDVVEQCFVTL